MHRVPRGGARFILDMAETMTETEFLTLADGIMKRIEAQADQWFEELDIDVETERNGGVLTLTFENQAQVVINGQPPLQEMWLAAPRGGFHYRLENGVWKDTRGGLPLHEALSEIVSELSGRELKIEL